MTTRQKLLLAFVGAAGPEKEIDPIRIMKGQFVFAKEAPPEWLSDVDRYTFVPYQFGPCSFDIYGDLEWLERHRLVKSRQVSGQSWKYYSLTDFGAHSLHLLSSGLRPEAVNYLQKLRQWVDGLSFRNLLASVYRKYPDYAVNSVFQF